MVYFAMWVCMIFPLTPAFAVIPVAFDFETACRICDSIPLSPLEGVWSYPSDNVTVLITRDHNSVSTALPTYCISVVESFDTALRPGDVIGDIKSTLDRKKFTISLFTHKRNGKLSKKKSVGLSLADDNEVLLFDTQKRNSKFRLNINPYSLLPGFWKIFRSSFSPDLAGSAETRTGMVKIYPSYDGNGSSRRSPRYL